jgi:hypothetical protein
MLQVSEYAADALRRVQQEFPTAIIAGGYLRDLDHGVEPKDIDIFIETNFELDTFEQLKDCLPDHYGRDVTRNSEYAKGDTAFIHGVYEFRRDGATPLNIIACNKAREGRFMQEQLARFDIGLCQVAFDGNKFEVTTAYCVDKYQRTLTLVNPWSVAHSIDRARRISLRYPGWRIIGQDGVEIPKMEEFDFGL